MTRALGTYTPITVKRSLRQAGESIRTWRKLQGVTQTEIADRAGIDPRTLRNLELGRGTLSFEAALRVLNALGVLEAAIAAIDPYNSDVGRLRADERLPERVRRGSVHGRARA